MRLGAERLEVVEGERLHAVLVVHPSVVSVLAAGGLDHLRHALEDVGFSDVRAWTSLPPGWSRDVPAPSDLEWRLWVAGTPLRSASLTRDVTEDLRVVDAWVAGDEPELSAAAGEPRRPLHPYAVAWSAPARIAGVLHAFGTAYPFDGVL